MKQRTESRRNNYDMIVSRRLRERRVMLGLSQINISEILDVSIQQVQKYENGKNRISCGKLPILCKALKVPPQYFFMELKIDEMFEDESLTLAEEKELIKLYKCYKSISNPNLRKNLISFLDTLNSTG